MATAAGGKTSVLMCPVCEESYNESSHLPKGFPCQHSVCVSCLEQMIERCDGAEVTCPLCRHTVPIPQAGAAGFPNNLTVLDLITSAGHPQHDAAPSTCPAHTGKPLTVWCSTCQQALCVTCMIKSTKHSDHEMGELSEVLENCIEQSQECIDAINTTCKELQERCTTMQENITEKAKAGNPDSLTMLRTLQQYQSDLMLCASADRPLKQEACSSVAEKPEAPPLLSAPLLPPASLAPAPKQLPTVEWIRPVDKTKFEPIASARLPGFKHIDINRKNNLLLVFPHGQHAVYTLTGQLYSKLEDNALAQQCGINLAEAHTVMLSPDNRVVCQDQERLMAGNTTYNMEGKQKHRVSAYHGDWFVLTTQNRDELVVEIISEKHERCLDQKKISGFLVKIVPEDEYDGFVVFYSRGKNGENFVLKIQVSQDGSVQSKDDSKVDGRTGQIRSAAFMKERPMVLDKNGSLMCMWYYKPCNVFIVKHHISLSDLGLPADSELVRIWAGDTADGGSVLHVLYSDRLGSYLAAYRVKDKLLKI